MIKSKKRAYIKSLEEQYAISDDDTASNTSEISEQVICVSNVESQAIAKQLLDNIFETIQSDNAINETLLGKLIKILQQNDTDFVISILLHLLHLSVQHASNPRYPGNQLTSTALVATVIHNLEQVRSHVCAINTILNKQIIVQESTPTDQNQ